MVSRYLIFCTSCPRCFFFCTASLIRKCFPLTHYFRFKLYIIFNKKRDIEFSNSCPVTPEELKELAIKFPDFDIEPEAPDMIGDFLIKLGQKE